MSWTKTRSLGQVSGSQWLILFCVHAIINSLNIWLRFLKVCLHLYCDLKMCHVIKYVTRLSIRVIVTFPLQCFVQALTLLLLCLCANTDILFFQEFFLSFFLLLYRQICTIFFSDSIIPRNPKLGMNIPLYKNFCLFTYRNEYVCNYAN